MKIKIHILTISCWLKRFQRDFLEDFGNPNFHKLAKYKKLHACSHAIGISTINYAAYESQDMKKNAPKYEIKYLTAQNNWANMILWSADGISPTAIIDCLFIKTRGNPSLSADGDQFAWFNILLVLKSVTHLHKICLEWNIGHSN